MSLKKYLEFPSMRFKLKTYYSSVPHVEVDAMLLATSFCRLCVWRNFIFMLSHTQDISLVYSLKCYSALWHNVGIISNSGTCKKTQQRDQTDKFPLYIIRRGELES